ncbi:MAG TPA: ISNCY family transposase [bacterium]|nr:ISNCY family transposase [bacterium]
MITLTPRAEQCLKVLHALDRGKLLVAEAAQLLGRSVRQVRRLRAALRARGPVSLVHGNRGRPPVNRIADTIRARVVRLATRIYVGVNDHHLQELLAEREGLSLSRPSVRRILRAAGVPSPRRRRPPRHRRRRARMLQEGLLVQLDGSTHAWLDQRGPRLTLVAAMDDATGEVPAATFRDEEDAHGYFLVLQALTQRKGIPVAVYSDRHGIFHRTPTTRTLTLQEQLAGKPAPTQVARALQELSIRWIPASSPQAKGRIERLFGTFQDRLRAELRLAGVTNREGANAFLADFLPRSNARFAHPPSDPTSAYRPWPAGRDPQAVFCFKYQRTVDNDNTVTLGGQRIQLLPGPQRRSYAKALVEIHERLDGTIAVFYQRVPVSCQRLTPAPPTDRIPARLYARGHSRPLPSGRNGPKAGSEIAIPSRQTRPRASGKASLATNGASRAGRTQQWKPAPDHPWRHMPLGKRKPEHKSREDKIAEPLSGQNH